jgi:hypothetical protein
MHDRLKWIVIDQQRMKEGGLRQRTDEVLSREKAFNIMVA